MKPPFWATRQFRWLILALILSASGILVLQLEVLPLLRSRQEAAAPPSREEVDRLLAAAPGADKAAVLTAELGAVADATRLDRPDAAYFSVLRRMRGTDTGMASADAPQVDFQTMLLFPEALRGRAVRFDGVFLHSDPVTVQAPGAPETLVFRTYLVDPGYEQGYVVDALESPLGLEPRTPVAVFGIFLKNGSYDGGKGQVVAPFFPGGRITAAAPAASGGRAGSLKVILGALAGLAILLLAITFWNFMQARRRPPPGYRPSPGRFFS